jgi:predicted porin
MKKQGIFLSCALLCGTAMANDSLQLFGAVDTGVTYGHGSISDRTQLTQSNNAVSKLGLRGSESLGGGLSASFFLEGSIQSDSGAGVATSSNNQPLVGAPAASPGGQGFTFNRRSTVSLAGNFGEVRLGRDVTPQYWNAVFADPFGHLGVGASQLLGSNRAGPAFVRVSNSIHYFTPQAGGFFAHAAYYLGENPGGTATEDDGTGAALRVGYTTGPWSMSAAAARTSYASGDIGTQSLLGIWQGTFLKLMALVHRDTNSSAVPGGRGWQLSAVQAVRTGEIRASVSSYRSDVVSNPGTSKLALGYVHNLSRRSALYATVAHLRNRGGASAALGGAVTGANGRSSGIDLGVRHLF